MKTRLACLLFCLAYTVPLAAQDAIDLHACVMVPPGLADWPITTVITHLDLTPNGMHVEFAKRDGPTRWPDVMPSGWTGPIQYTVWLAALVNGQCHVAASLNVWYGNDNYGGPMAQGWHWPKDLWYLDSALGGHTPAVGETVGLMVTSGAERGIVAPSVAERSALVTFPFPPVTGQSYSFGAPPVPIPIPTPVPSPAPVPAPTPLPSIDLSPVLNLMAINQAAVLAAIADAKAVVGQKVDDFRAAVKSVWQQIGEPILKYVVPAIAAYVAGKKL